MIKGIGTDIIAIARIQKLMDRFKPDSLLKIFTSAELTLRKDRTKNDSSSLEPTQASRLAGRFAAKEAFSKALGCGLGSDIWFNDIEILNNDKGAPFIRLTPKIESLLKRKGGSKIFLSISHEKDTAIAFVVIE